MLLVKVEPKRLLLIFFCLLLLLLMLLLLFPRHIKRYSDQIPLPVVKTGKVEKYNHMPLLAEREDAIIAFINGFCPIPH